MAKFITSTSKKSVLTQESNLCNKREYILDNLITEGLIKKNNTNFLTGMMLMEKKHIIRSFDNKDKQNSFIKVIDPVGIRPDYEDKIIFLKNMYEKEYMTDATCKPMMNWVANLERQIKCGLFKLNCFSDFTCTLQDLLLMKSFAIMCGVELIVATYDLVRAIMFISFSFCSYC